MEDQLVDFIRGKKGKAPSPDIDWQAKKDTWVGSVDSLCGYVREMLRESIASNDVTTNTVNVEVSEDFIGSYSMPVLELRACRTITFTIRNVLATSREAAVNNSILDFAGVAEGSVASSARQ